MCPFLKGYIETALWLAEDEMTLETKDSRGELARILPAVLKEMAEDCEAFWQAHSEELGTDYERAGSDFFLSRNGHGAGYFDGDYGDHCRTLQLAARVYGTFALVVPASGSIYSHG